MSTISKELSDEFSNELTRLINSDIPYSTRLCNVFGTLPGAIVRATGITGAVAGIVFGSYGSDSLLSCEGVLDLGNPPSYDCILVGTPLVIGGVTCLAYLVSRVAAPLTLPSDAKQACYDKVLVIRLTDKAAQRAFEHYIKYEFSALGSLAGFSIISAVVLGIGGMAAQSPKALTLFTGVCLGSIFSNIGWLGLLGIDALVSRVGNCICYMCQSPEELTLDEEEK